MSTNTSKNKGQGKRRTSRVKVKKAAPPNPPPPTARSETEDEDATAPAPEDISVTIASKPSLVGPRVSQDRTRLQQLLAATESRARLQSVWETVCYEIEGEYEELDVILTKLGLPPYNYRKDKIFALPSFTADDDDPPPVESCITRVYLDYYIFPLVLSAIQSMILYARKNRVFQCHAGLFNPMDYIVEYLYANNPKHPERKDNLIPLMEIPFVDQWLNKNPRPPYPKWLYMSLDLAARKIQGCVRMWLARRKRRQLELKRNLNGGVGEIHQREKEKVCDTNAVPGPLFGPYYDEIIGEGGGGDGGEKSATNTHSYQCLLCNRFKQFVQDEDNRRQAKGNQSS